MGDTYTGKVVKTTQFGAFVELKKGTDGLLHVSNVGPGRVAHIEDVMARGDVVDVVVQEVDKARGRIGLKLVAKHENGSLVQPEELIERAKDAPPRPPEEDRPRRDDRGRGRGGAAAATARPAPRGLRPTTDGDGRPTRPTVRATDSAFGGRALTLQGYPPPWTVPMTSRETDPLSCGRSSLPHPLAAARPARGHAGSSGRRSSCPSCSARSPGRSPSRSATGPSRSTSTGRPGTTSTSRPCTATTRRAALIDRVAAARSGTPCSTSGSTAAAPTSSRRRVRLVEDARQLRAETSRGGADAWHPDDALFLPMRHSDGHLLGILSVDEPRHRPRPTDEELDVLVALADHAAQAVQAAQEAARPRSTGSRSSSCSRSPRI